MLLVTHIDLDGVMCAILHKLAFGAESAVEYVNYDTIDEVLTRITRSFPEDVPEKPDTLFITDLYPTEAGIEKIGYLLNWANETKRMKVRLFDHHKTSLPLKQYDWVSHRLDVCGAQNYYNWLIEHKYLGQSDGIGNLVHLTDLWDRRIAGDPLFGQAKELNSLLYFFGKESFVSRCLALLPRDVLLEHRDVILAMRTKEEEAITAILEKGPVTEVTDFQGKKLALFVSSGAGSLSNIADRILQAYPQVDYAAGILPGSNTVSLRSRDDGLDIEPVAKTFGGGGHPHAAGFPFRIRELLIALIGEMLQCGTKECKTPSSDSSASEK